MLRYILNFIQTYVNDKIVQYRPILWLFMAIVPILLTQGMYSCLNACAVKNHKQCGA